MLDQTAAREMWAAGSLTGHWSWRPDWTARRRNWWWYATFEADATVQRLATSIQSIIKPGAPVDAIPPRWLHMSIAEMGYVEDLPPDLREGCVRAAREALAGMQPSTLTVGPVRAMAGAVVLEVQAPALLDLHDRLLRAIAGTVPRPLEQRPFVPHISVAYVRDDCASEDVFDPATQRACDPAQQTASTELAQIALVEVVRDQRHYRWTRGHRVTLGSR